MAEPKLGVAAGCGAGLQAALLLARGKPEGLARLGAEAPAEMRMAARSFWAIALCLPAFVCLHLAEWAELGVPPHAARGLAAALIGYVLGWVGFALLSHRIAAGLDRAARWPRFIAIWNWCNVVQYLMWVAAALPPLLGLPDLVGETAWLVSMGWALWLEWFATKLALDVGGRAAAGLVAVDFAVGVAVLGVLRS